jgi:hypothetical protein
MSRYISSSLKTYLQQSTIDWAVCVAITRQDGAVIALTSWDQPIVFTYNTVTYTFLPALSGSLTSLKNSTDLSTDTLELIGLIKTGYINTSDLENGLYDLAKVSVIELSPTNLGCGCITNISGIIGEVVPGEVSYSAEVRSKLNLLSQTVGDSCSLGCRVRQLGDSQCKVSISSYENNRTLSGIGGSTTAISQNTLLQINAGGPAVSPFVTDTDYSTSGSGSTITVSTSNTIVLPSVNAAPEAVYQTYRIIENGGIGGSLLYTLSGYTPGKQYTVRLHFAESFFQPAWPTDPYDGSGKRQFNVLINGILTLYYYDIWVDTGGSNIGIAKDFYCYADVSGNIVITFESLKINNPLICGIEIIDPGVPSIANALVFGSDTQMDGYYENGRVLWLTGANTGRVSDIQQHRQSSGSALITLWEEPISTVTVGDTATLVAGCDRTYSMCLSKFNNIVNFHGEPFVPGSDALMRQGGT